MGNKKLWCVAIRPEADSPYEQTPAVSREVAQQAVARYRKMNKYAFSDDLDYVAWCDEFYQVQQWHGTRKDHIRKMFYTQDWFNQPMYQIFDMTNAESLFKRDDLVICYRQGFAPITTKDINEARAFYEGSD